MVRHLVIADWLTHVGPQLCAGSNLGVGQATQIKAARAKDMNRPGHNNHATGRTRRRGGVITTSRRIAQRQNGGRMASTAIEILATDQLLEVGNGEVVATVGARAT